MTTAGLSYTAADILFDPVAHEYRLPDGQLVPGVTGILRSVGVSADFDEIASYSPRTADAVGLKRELGHALHADAHAFDDDDLVWDSVDPRVQPYLTAWAIFRENSKVKPTTRERLVYHSTLGYAGTLDGIFELPNGRRVLIDLKTGDPRDSGCQYQTAAYLAAFVGDRDVRVDERWAVQLTPERTIPYRITPYTDWQDFGKFQAFITTYHCQAARRGRRA